MLNFLKKRRYRNTVCTSDFMNRVRQYLSENYTPPPYSSGTLLISAPPVQPPASSSIPAKKNSVRPDVHYSAPSRSSINDFPRGFADHRLNRPIDEVNADLYQTLEMTFVDKLLDYISEKNLKDTQVYKAAHMDRKLFSKIASKRDYTPSKDSCLALCFALHLSLDDTKDMLQRAEHALTHSNKRDIVIEYLIQEQVYDLFEVDEVLYRLGMKTLGS